MPIRFAPAIPLLAFMMQHAAAQDQPGVAIRALLVDAGNPVEHFALCDLDGDGRNDAWFVTRTRPALSVVARRTESGGFEPPAASVVPEDSEGLILQPLRSGAAVLSLGRLGVATALPAHAASAVRPLPPGPAPAFLGFAQDVDGDGAGDVLAPVASGFELALSASGRRVAIRPPVARTRDAGLRGLLAERARYPLVSLEVLASGAPPRPLFFANDALQALRGTLEQGFGPEVETVLKVPSGQQEATLERTEARLVDLEGDGARELLVVRTKTQGSALAQVRTELIFHRIGGPDAGRPVQAILLPGILASGPAIKDVDRDGRLDLFLSVFGEDLGQQVTRRITGKVKLEYLLYRGAAQGPPFLRSPDFSEVDAIPETQFSDWRLRDRLILDDDWTGDGVPDVVAMSVDARATRIEVRGGGSDRGRAGFTKKPSASSEADVSVKDHRAWRLGPSEPAILCRTETGALIFAGGTAR
jgi:hypothetical protein